MATRDDSYRILVIDDDAALRGLLTVLFEREGWDVVTAADGEVAVQQMSVVDPDVVILDLMLPKLMGLDVLRQIAARDPTCSGRVLIVTAVAEIQLRSLPDDLNVWQVIRKPFDNAELIDAARTCARRHARVGSRA